MSTTTHASNGNSLTDTVEGPIKVTVSCSTTGKILSERVIDNDYILVTAGKRYLKSSQVMGRTHMLAVAYEWK